MKFQLIALLGIVCGSVLGVVSPYQEVLQQHGHALIVGQVGQDIEFELPNTKQNLIYCSQSSPVNYLLVRDISCYLPRLIIDLTSDITVVLYGNNLHDFDMRNFDTQRQDLWDMFHGADEARVIYYHENKYHEVLFERNPESLAFDYTQLSQPDTCILQCVVDMETYIITQKDCDVYQKMCYHPQSGNDLVPQWIVHKAQAFDFHALHHRNISPVS
jgi:hypothetical protein